MLHFWDTVDFVLREILNKESFLRRLFELHFGFSVLGEEIMYLFVINFDETASNKMSPVSYTHLTLPTTPYV